MPCFRQCGQSCDPMASLTLPAPNKLGVVNGPEPVWHRGGGWGWQKFAAASGRSDRSRSSIEASEGRATRAGGVLQCALPACMGNQALSAGQDPAVAPAPSHRAMGMADCCALGVPGRRIASYQTLGRSGQLGTALAAPALDRPGGVSPLSIDLAPPYPGRAGQTQHRQKPARARSCDLGCTEGTTRQGARNLSRVPMGSGVWAALTRKALGREKGGIVRTGCGDAASLRHGLRLDRGKTAKLGGGRG